VCVRYDLYDLDMCVCESVCVCVEVGDSVRGQIVFLEISPIFAGLF